MRLRFLRPGECFTFRCTPDQLPRFAKVIKHNGGLLTTDSEPPDTLIATVCKGCGEPAGSEESS